MTNGEKYLKDNIKENDFADMCVYLTRYFDNEISMQKVAEFFKKEATPTLTEDERVILRNLNEQIWEKIGRDKYGALSLKTRTEDDENFFNGCYGHLFQFIKERRRI